MRFVAVDWGTSNRRAWLIEDGTVAVRHRDDRGVTAVAAGSFAAAAAALRDRFGGAPLVLAGMIGSTRGWIDAGYVPCPATIGDIAAATVRPAPGIAILPGVAQRHPRPDVMRGEEVQFLGAAAAGLVPPDGFLCQPGTHAKWARLEHGAIAGFTTAMTGEMYAILAAHALIGAAMVAPVADTPAFRDGVADAGDIGGDGDLLARLFGVRAASVLGTRDDADAAAYVSGLLIGADVAARLRDAPDRRVHLLADDTLGPLYATAIAARGGEAVRIDSETAFLAGIVRIGTSIREPLL